MNALRLGSIRARLIATFALLMVLLVASLTIAGSRVSSMNDALVQINEVNSVKQRQAINFRGSVHDRSILVRDLVLFTDRDDIQRTVHEIESLTAAYDSARTEMDRLMAEFPAADEAAAYKRIQEIERQTLPLIDLVVEQTSRGVADDAVHTALADSRPLFVDWLAAINVFIDLEEEKNHALGAQVSSIASSFTGLMIALGVGTLILGTTVGGLLLRHIASRINAIESGMSSVTAHNGMTDLTVRLNENTGDEFGRIAAACNRVLIKLSETIQSVANASSAVASSSSEVASWASQIETATQRQLDQTGQVAAAVEETSASISQIASSGSSAAQASQRSEKSAREGGQIVRNVIDQMKTIARHVEESSREVTDLGRKGETIGQVIAMINDIADQTNLLALNAAIEAARAGEHGRGFAVVADEVRKLAERTTNATDEVSRSISEIQAGTKAASDRMLASTSGVEAGVELATSAGSALDEIVGDSSSVLQMTQGMAEMTDQHATVSADISRSVTRIKDLCSEAAESAASVSSASGQLVQRAGELDNLVRQFRVASGR